MINSVSIVIIRIKGEHLLYSKISGGMIGYGWGNVCYIVNFPPGEYLLYSKVSGRKVYYIATIPRGNVYYIVSIPGESAEGLLYDTGRSKTYISNVVCRIYVQRVKLIVAKMRGCWHCISGFTDHHCLTQHFCTCPNIGIVRTVCYWSCECQTIV